MSQERREIPNDEADNPFRALSEFITIEKVSVATLATAIENHGIYTWDRFGRYKKMMTGEYVDRALKLLADHRKWERDPDIEFLEDPRSPLQQYEGDWDNPYDHFGWAAEVVPDFESIHSQQLEAPPGNVFKPSYKASAEFVDALIKLLVELGKRDHSLNTGKMPGIKTDFYALAIKFTGLDHPLSTFNDYIKPFCKFGRGSKSSEYYRSHFPEYFK